MAERKIGYGSYSAEVTISQHRETTVIVAYEKDLGEVFLLVQDRIADGSIAEVMDGEFEFTPWLEGSKI